MRIKIRALVLISVLFFCHLVFSQHGKEAWNWHFGVNASINFSSGAPIVGTTPMFTREGCASISDKLTGQTLFYTSGDTVWNRNHVIMPNGSGLKGGQLSSTQAALIVPKPNSSSVYFLFTSDQGGYDGPNKGVFYSIVDMSLNGGLGDVTTKNTLLTPPPCTEKLTAVRHCNGKDFWVITHPFNSNAFNAYLVTSAGVNSTPIISHAGKFQNSPSGSNLETIGYLKASPNGKKLALGIAINDSLLEIFDFDNATGQVSNAIPLHLNQGAYGVTFSPNSKLLYTTYSEAMGDLDQFDISSNIGTVIQASKTTLATDLYYGAMQIAPDGKIYITKFFTPYLDVINNPDNQGISCNFQDSVVNLLPNRGWYGLPNFIDAYGETPPTTNTIFTPLCSINNYTLAVTGLSNYSWSTGDTTHHTIINTTGNYWVTYINQLGCWQIDTIKVSLNPTPIINLVSKPDFCAQKTMLITSNDSSTYLWNTGETTSTIALNTSGLYWVKVTNQYGCSNTDSIFVEHKMINDISKEIPNVLTPNADGVNDKIDFGSYHSNINHVSIYNRWGEIIFNCDNLPCIWQPHQNDGTYFYIIEYTDSCEAKTKYIKGCFTLF